MPALPEDGVETESLFSMSEEERKKWVDIILGKAPGSLSETEQLVAILGSLKKSAVLPDAQLVDLLEELKFMAELTHTANGIYSLGGLDHLLGILQHPNERVREQVAWVLQSAIQNNGKFQAEMMKRGGVARLLQLARPEKSPMVLHKLWGAIAAMVRSFDPGADQFFSEGGFKLALSALELDDAKVQQRLAFLFSYLMQEEPRATAEVFERDHALSALLPNLTNPEAQVRRHLAEGLARWCERDGRNLEFLNLYGKPVTQSLKAAETLGKREGDKDFVDNIAKLQSQVQC